MSVEVCLYGDPVLREKGKAIEKFDQEFQAFAEAVRQYVVDNDNAAGLAAQQAGKALRFFVVEMSDEPRYINYEFKYDGKSVPVSAIMPLVVVNPEIEELSEETVVYNESCLSFPGLGMDVERPEFIKLTFQDIDGHKHTLETNGSFARVLLHEYDHIEGILFIDRVHPRDRKRNEAKLKQLKRMTRDKMKKRKKK